MQTQSIKARRCKAVLCVSVPACHRFAMGHSHLGPRVLCQAKPWPLLPQFPSLEQEVTLAVRPATWAASVNIWSQRGAGVGNRWNS